MRIIFMSRSQTLVSIAILASMTAAAYFVWNMAIYGPTPHLTSSLTYSYGKFYLSDKEIKIFSGALHYFRVVPEYWDDRLKKFKAAGLSTVETYVPWNLHEEVKGNFTFSGNLDIRKFINKAYALGLYVIVRPGPYICAEWEFGGLPSWLLGDPQMRVRSIYPKYLDAVERYFQHLFAEIGDLQYSAGGPIIAMQIENEYGSYGDSALYMSWLKERMIMYGVRELLFTSDNGVESMKRGSLPDTLITANLKHKETGEELQQYLEQVQPHAPFFVMEFWTGWFDHWGESRHNTWVAEEFEDVLKYLLESGASINFYMMAGGTNFGFMNGANYPNVPQVTSYDYDAPISENGDITRKYIIIQKLLTGKTEPKSLPANVSTQAYGEVLMTTMAPYNVLVNPTPLEMSDVVSMEMLDVNNGGGQGYGFIVYQTVIHKGGELRVRAKDAAWVMVDHELKTMVQPWGKQEAVTQLRGVKGLQFLSILVENMGRVNYVNYESDHLNHQHKGLVGKVTLNNMMLESWLVSPLEMKRDQMKSLFLHNNAFEEVTDIESSIPYLYRGTLRIRSQPKDTFLTLPGWTKGVAFINGFNLGRYCTLGPQQSLYVPAPLLTRGINEVFIFELLKSADPPAVKFVDRPQLSTPEH